MHTNNILVVIGCDYGSQTGKQCDYWVHATCLAFPEAKDEAFWNITFHHPLPNRANITSMNCKQQKYIMFMEAVNSFFSFGPFTMCLQI